MKISSSKVYLIDEPSLVELQEQQVYLSEKPFIKNSNELVPYKEQEAFSKDKKYNLDENGIVTYPIEGLLTSNTSYIWWYYGYELPYEYIEHDFKLFANDNRVKGVLLDIYSPGGEGIGYSDAINNILNLGKPIVTHSRAWTMSMAYMFAACSNFIVASETSRIGSVGSIWFQWNISKALKDQGIEPVIIRGGVDKGRPRNDEPVNDESYLRMKEWVNQEYKSFTEFIAKQRNLSLETDNNGLISWAEGRHFGAEEALNLGLINQIGSKDQAYEHLVGLIDTGQPVSIQDSISISLTSPNNMNVKIPKIPEIEALESKVELLQGELVDKTNKITSLEAENQALKSEKEAREMEDKTNLISQIDSLKSLTASEKTIYNKCSFAELTQIHTELKESQKPVENEAEGKALEANTATPQPSPVKIVIGAVVQPGAEQTKTEEAIDPLIQKTFEHALGRAQ